MASDRGYLEFILEQLADLDGVRARAMMGEYILYYRDRVIGGIYDDRLLVKATPGAVVLYAFGHGRTALSRRQTHAAGGQCRRPGIPLRPI